MKAHCLFEQSGTFKNEFKKLGIESYDYDIQNDYNETDYIIDLFYEIEQAYYNQKSIFDKILEQDIIIAFYPCTRFENQATMMFLGNQYQQKNWNELTKLEYNLKLHKELHELYKYVTMLAIICLRKNLKLIIENPYSTQHYLQRYWSIKPKIIDLDRTKSGDYYIKPTQYWFINTEPKNNLLMNEPYIINTKPKQICGAKRTKNGYEKGYKYGDKETQKNRSLISPIYANRFIREYIL